MASEVDKIGLRLKQATANWRGALASALYKEAWRILAEAQKIVPIRFGRLRRSAFVSRPFQLGRTIAVKLGYGTNYALPVHEKTDPGVQWTTPGTGPKYLQKPFEAAMPTFRADVQRQAQADFAAGIKMRIA